VIEHKLAGRGARPGETASTLAALLGARALESPDSRVYTFLSDGEREAATLTFGQLHRRALMIAAGLGRVTRPGARTLLLYPPGLDYVCAFFGCLYAGVVAVPLYPLEPSRARRSLPRLLSVVADAQPEVTLTTREVIAQGGLGDEILPASVRVITTDAPDDDGHDGDAPVLHEALPTDVALLQYTSGSTSSPRGVMLTHANMLANAAIQRRAWGLGRDSVGVSWLPLYHDLGVITCLVQPLYTAFHTVMMSPAALLQRPARWLRAISRYRGTFAGGPNFVFALCVRHTSPEERQGLDLSSWRCAFNGGEPIRAETLETFAHTFAPCGFDPRAMYPCYGMAEANFISGGLSPRAPLVSRFRSVTVARGRSELTHAGEGDATTQLVGCGQIQHEQRVLVVDPATCQPCPEGRVGEIWVSGPSVGLGYFRREADTKVTFQARVDATNEGPFLRTGDLGAFVANELYVAGRLKDLIIVRGVNHCPQDLECLAEHAHPAVRPGCGAAFSVDVDGEEQVVLVNEVDTRGDAVDADAVFSAVRRAVAESHDLPVHAMVLIAPGTIAKTTSGKIQRSACRAAFLAGTLKPLAQWHRAAPAPANAPGTARPPADAAASGSARSAPEIHAWLVAQIATRLGIDPRDVDPTEPFVSYGMDSREAVGLSGDLERWLGRRVSPTVAYAHPSVAALARYLADPAANQRETMRGTAALADPAEPIAIVGVGCRFPGAPDPEGYWRLLRDGVDAIREVPADRWDARAYYDADPSARGKMNSLWGGFLDQLDHFDPLFFGISPREAMHMDPQQRLLLEVAWEAMEDAGVPPSELAGSPVGVFVGVTTDDYGRLQMRDADRIGAYSATGSLLSIAANRVSYTFDFRGPSVAVDTACSASLVAIHYACQALRSGEVTAALAGGVNAIVSPENTVSQARLGTLAADGRCKTFDARADGIVRGEGAGVVMLKTLSRAVADGDKIYAVILGSAVNQDGRSNGLTAPNPEAQIALLREAYLRAAVSPGSVSYVEAHGTGTKLGDPIEARALGSVLAEGRAEGDRCAIGSVKTNFGHLEAAAGVAGLIKVALSMHHGAIPPSLHFQSVNPHIPLDELPLKVQTALTGWPAAHRPIAGVSSFGIGGTNAHVVLAAAPPASMREADGPRQPSPGRAHLLPLSARSPEALRALARAHAVSLSDPAVQGPRADADRCYTAGVRRDHHEHRAAFVAHTGEELRDQLEAFAGSGSAPGISAGRAIQGRRVAFVFSGQGGQRPGAGRELLECEPAFREAVERCDRILAPALGWSVAEQIARPGPEEFSERNDVVQPVMFTLQVALAALFGAWGIEPDAVVGHSMGEVAAAHVSGALTLAQAAQVIVGRSRELMRVWRQGAMLLVGLPAEDAARVAADHPGRLHVAVVNGPRSAVLSGDEDAVREAQAALESLGVFCQPVKTGCAGHSPLMDPLATSLRATLEAMAPAAPARPFYSTVSDGACELDAGYWADNLRQPVRFYPAVQAMLADGFDLFVELSPHPTLGSSVAQAMESAGVRGTVLGSLRRDESEPAALRASLGGLYAAGRDVRFAHVSPASSRLAKLPTYPFQRQRYWLDPAPGARPGGEPSPARATGVHPLLGRAVPLATPSGAVVWENRVSFATDAFVPEHGLQGAVVFNTFAYLDAALAAARAAAPEGALRVEGAEFRKVMFVPEGGAREVQWHAAPDGAGFSVQAYGRDASDAGAAWVLHAIARVSRDESGGEPADLAALRARCASTVPGEEVYAGLATFGANLGPRFRGLVRAHVGDGEALGEVEAPEGLADESGPYAFHPALFDACAQTLVMTSPERRGFMPVKIGSTRVFRRPPRVLWSHARMSSLGAGAGEGSLYGDVRVYDEDGAPVAELRDIELRYMDRVQAPAAQSAHPAKRAGEDRAALALMAPEARAVRVREYLAATAAGVLHLEAPVSDADAALDTMGLDSLMAVELKRRIATDLGADVPLVSFLRHVSLAQLGDAVLQMLDPAEPTPSGAAASASRPALDLEAEVVLDEDVRARPGQRAPQGTPERPLLTGVTGYLGAFLLADLLRTCKGELRCLVRAPDAAAGRARIQRALAQRGLWEPSFAGRVVPVLGDLAQPRLGLSPRKFDALADAVDAVYHNGALVNFLFPYEEMRATNVGGTTEILRLATRGALKPVHFVSSLSVFFTSRYAGKTVAESETPTGAEHLPLQGYAQSKWVAERLISLARERGIPATSYRPVFIGWHSRTGEYNPDDFLCRFIQACMLLGAAPEIDMNLMIAPVDYVSAATVALSRRPDAAGKNYHLTHSSRVTWSDLLELLGETRHRVARVPYASWRERLVVAAASESGKGPLRTLVPLFPPGEMDESVTELMSAGRAPVFDSAATRADLAPSEIACPALDASLLRVFVEKLARDREESYVSRTG